jgi:hypothetical protein
MNTIDLTTPAAAAAYLRSLDPSTPVELAGAYENRPASAASDAVAVITGETSNAWAVSQNRWEWTAGELVAALLSEAGDYIAYGPNARWGSSIGFFLTEAEALAYVEEGTEGDFGAGAYVALDHGDE